ncbi:GNAT family N-acetyltransferase [Lutispora sp.]|uniref:GNAT family N-acetyltransferase n=1 Tax=Lutispora sp. TaxID=2828727 RepID=UPI003565D7F9
MDNNYYVDHIVNRNNVIFRILAKGKNMIHHKGNIEWFMTDPKGGIERIFGMTLNENNAQKEIEDLIIKIKSNLAPSIININPHSTPYNIGDILISNGFTLWDKTAWGYGMAMDLQGMKFYDEYPEKIIVKRVEDSKSFEYWIHILNNALFVEPCLWIKSNDFAHLQQLNNLILYVAYYDGDPAGISSACFDNEAADINFVATLDGYRKKGVATAAIHKALKEMQQMGIKIATLTGEYSAKPLYERIGFKTYCEFRTYEYEK